jgi:hypothetical protein
MKSTHDPFKEELDETGLHPACDYCGNIVGNILTCHKCGKMMCARNYNCAADHNKECSWV